MKTITAIRNEIALMAIIGLLLVTTTSPALAETWTYKTSMPTGRGFTAGTVADGKIYMIGGFPTHNSVTQSNEMYEPSTDTWTTRAGMPEGRCAHATCTYNGNIYVFGGVSPDPYASAKNNVYLYNPQTDTWIQKADMPYSNAFCGIATVNDTIYLIGGMTSHNAPPKSTVMAYHPLTDSWSEKAPMPTARGMLSACAVDGKIYAIGGTINFLTSSYKIVEVYDPATNSWITKANMPTARVALGVCVLSGKIYAIGGYNYPVMYNLNEMYDPDSDTWITKSPMQETRQMFFLGPVGEKIYAIGGSYPNPQNPAMPVILSSTEEYSPESTNVGDTFGAQINPTEFKLEQNFPNPFNANTLISYFLPEKDFVKLTIYNLSGQLVKTLVCETQSAGIHDFCWDSRDDFENVISSGLYLVQLKTSNQIQSIKLLYNK